MADFRGKVHENFHSNGCFPGFFLGVGGLEKVNQPVS